MTGVSRRNLLLACSLLAALLPPASAQAPAIPASAASGAPAIAGTGAAAARRLGMMRKGVIHARQEVVDPGSAGIKSAAND